MPSPAGSRFGAGVRRIAGACLLLALPPAGAQQAEPVFPCANLDQLVQAQRERRPAAQEELWRLRDWLDACTRRVRPSERVLYTWGHRIKLTRMLESQRLQFCAYDDARQARYIALRMGPGALDGEQGKAGVPRAALLAEARAFAGDERLFDLYALAFARRDAPLHDRPRVLDSALYLAMFERWMPGFLGVLDRPLDQIEAALRAERDGLDGGSLRAHAIDGELDAIVQFRSKAAQGGGVNFLTSSSLGVGVSFSSDPVAFAQHFYDEQHMGLACRLPANDPRIILDLRDAPSRQRLKWGNVLLRTPEDHPDPDATDGPAQDAAQAGDPTPAAQRPPQVPFTTLTEFVRPPVFESAARGRILLARAGSNPLPVYADKCAIEYRVACQPITLDSFPCSRWPALRAHSRYAGSAGEPGGGVLRRHFRSLASAAGTPADAAEQAYAALELAKDAQCDAERAAAQTTGEPPPAREADIWRRGGAVHRRPDGAPAAAEMPPGGRASDDPEP